MPPALEGASVPLLSGAESDAPRRVGVVLSLPQTGICKDRRERRAAAVGERIGSALAVVGDEPADGHGLHGMGENSDRGVINPRRGTEQDDAVLRTELRRRLCHGSLPPPALGEAGHRAARAGSRAVRRVAPMTLRQRSKMAPGRVESRPISIGPAQGLLAERAEGVFRPAPILAFNRLLRTCWTRKALGRAQQSISMARPTGIEPVFPP